MPSWAAGSLENSFDIDPANPGVFVSTQDDKRAASPPETGPGEWNAAGRLLAARRGERNLGQRLLEIAVTGFDDYGRAAEAAARTINESSQSILLADDGDERRVGQCSELVTDIGTAFTRKVCRR